MMLEYLQARCSSRNQACHTIVMLMLFGHPGVDRSQRHPPPPPPFQKRQEYCCIVLWDTKLQGHQHSLSSHGCMWAKHHRVPTAPPPPPPPGLKQPAFQALTVSSRRQWCGGPASLSCSCISAALSTSALVPCMGALVACSSTCTSSLPASFCSSFMSGSWARSCVPRRLDRPCDCTQQWRQHTQDTCSLDVDAVGCSPLLCYM